MTKHLQNRLVIEIQTDETLETQTAIRKALSNAIKGEITDNDKQHLFDLLRDVTPTKDVVKGKYINLDFSASGAIERGIVA